MMINNTKLSYAVNGSKTWAGVLGLLAYLLIQWGQKLPADPVIISIFAGLAGIGLGHKALKSGRPLSLASSDSSSS